jgi:hypothetical protein
MSNGRDLPKGWLEKVNALRKDLLAKGFTIKPTPPKGPRASGPHLGTRWHEPAGQAEMGLAAEGLLSQERCAGCGSKVIAATGELHREKGLSAGWCGACFRTRPPADTEDRIPPPHAA